MITENRFGEYIANLRKEKQISLEQLSDGLCAISMLSRFEKGEREPDKLLQNRFLTRLGVVPENYENFLYYDDYCRWEKRQGILHYILEENIEEAKQLLESYRREYKMQEALEQQFYLAMLAQIRRYEGADYSELEVLFEQALQLTVPEIDSRSFRNRILSLEELNLLLEYRFCKREGISLKFYENLLEYIERMEQTILAKAKIMPKAVYYYYESWKAVGDVETETVEHLLELCDTAIEVLRNANRMFYLWELFCMREDLVEWLPEKRKTEETMQLRCQECNDWKQTLEELFEEYQITLPMYEYCYLYVESENYCIDDVIRIRRKMMGMSQETLSQGICDSRTVSRLERHLRKPQKEIVQQLFERLNLSTELCRTELVTDNQEAIEKYRELRHENNNRNNEKVSSLLEECKKIISMSNPNNKQLLSRNEAVYLYYSGKVSEKKYMELVLNALECTVNYSQIIAKKEKYLTNEEISCIHNLAFKSDISSRYSYECSSILLDLRDNMKYLYNNIRMYEFIMSAVVNYWGRCEKYSCVIAIEKEIIRLLLHSKRMGGIHEALYEMLWASMQNEFKCSDCANYSLQLKRCVSISILCKDIHRMDIYERKASQLQEYIS